MKIYTVLSLSESLATNKINELLKLCHVKQEDLVRYDMEEVPVQDAIFDANTANFLSPQKAILIKNPYFLTGSTKKGPLHDMTVLLKYFENPSVYNVVIFYGPYEKLDERKKVVKSLKKKSDVINLTPPNPFHTMDNIRRKLDVNRIKYDDQALGQLALLTKNDYEKMMKETEKIIDYFAEEQEKHLTTKVILELVPKSLTDNVFLLTEALATKNKKQGYAIYLDLMAQKEEPFKLIIMIANQFRLLRQVYLLASTGMYEKQIATELGTHPYRTKIALSQARRFKMNELDDAIEQLAKMDIDIKTGKIDPHLALELFILSQ